MRPSASLALLVADVLGKKTFPEMPNENRNTKADFTAYLLTFSCPLPRTTTIQVPVLAPAQMALTPAVVKLGKTQCRVWSPCVKPHITGSSEKIFCARVTSEFRH